MQVELQSSEGLIRRLSIQVPATEIDPEVDRRLQDMSRRVRMDGFRPGKAPMNVVRKRYLGQVRDDVVAEVMGRSYEEALADQKIRPAGSPKIESVEGGPGEALTFVAAVEVYPEFEFGDMSKLKIDRVTAEVNDEDVDEMIETLREQNAEWAPVKHKAKKGERVTINFTGRLDGEEFEGGSGEGMQVVLGEGRMLKDFEKGLTGIKPGEEPKVIDVAFPDDYPAENLQGKTAQFEIVATEVEAKKLPELDDAFAEKFGAKTVDDLKKEVRGNMERECKQAIRRRVKDNVLNSLADSLEFDIPEALIEDEAKTMRDSFVQNQMPSADASKLDAGLFREQAERRVKMGLIVIELVKVGDLKADEAMADAFIEEIASAYDNPEEVVKAYKADQQMMSNARTIVLEQQAVEWVMGQAKVTDKKVPFKELMNPQQD